MRVGLTVFAAILVLSGLAACVNAGRIEAGKAAPTGTQEVRTVGQLEQAVSSAGPGTCILLADGEYVTTRPIIVEHKRGTPNKPITIRSLHRGKAVIAGAAGICLRDCEYVVVCGLRFTHEAASCAVLLENCKHVRVTRNYFRLSERPEPAHWEHWVYATGANSSHNRFDHNLFERKKNPGSFLFVRGDDAAGICSRFDRIDHNHFRDVAYANGENGHETVRTGSNVLGHGDRESYTVIQSNLFERCSGETEMISLKSSRCTVRGNTIINCYGAISLRMGNNTTVSGNVVICDDRVEQRGGVKIYGIGHRILDNCFEGLTGTAHSAPLALWPGCADGPKLAPNVSCSCGRADSVIIAHNTWVDCYPLMFGKEDESRPLQPRNCIFVDNRVIGCRWAKPLIEIAKGVDVRFRNNVALASHPTTLGPAAGLFRIADKNQLDRIRDERSRRHVLTTAEVGPEAP